MKPILCLDFDGVCHSYVSGWKGAAIIPDAPVEDLYLFLLNALEVFDVQIFSSRSNQEGGIEAMRQWLLKRCPTQWLNIISEVKFPTEKPPAFVALDDRVITFTGTWPSIEELKNFKPWNKKEV